ncbi:MAG: ImmA/IrrE family metallo-endopeptidase [Candidatus Omnitrophota bacterium]
MMRWEDDSQSPYGCRLVCTGVDIDEAMEERYLKFHKGTCDIDHPALDIERFIDESLRSEHIEYEPEATDLPGNVLGETQFNLDGSRLIRINSGLYRQRNLLLKKGRFRFTCAHESFHAIFHTRLFRKGGRLICSGQHVREDMVESTPTPGDFTEWQANRGAAALLMPRLIFIENVKRIRAVSGSANTDILVQNLLSRFDVSKKSVQIRLQTLKLTIPRDNDMVLENDGIDSYVDRRER